MDVSGIGSLMTEYAASTANSRNADNLKDKLANSDQATDEELMKVCKEFEAYFTEQVYKEMMKTVPKSDGENSALVDYFKDMTLSEIAQRTVDERGSAGLAQSLYEQMRRNSGQ